MNSKNRHSYFSETHQLNYSQTYPNRSLKYPELTNLLQNAAANHTDFAKLGFDDLQQHDQAWVMSRFRIEIEEMPQLNDEIVIDTWVEVLRGPKSIRNFTVTRQSKKLVGASSLWAVFNTKKRRPEALAIDSSSIERYPTLHATKQENAKIDFDHIPFEFLASHRVMLSDLDVVNHVNNIKYFEWCLNYLAVDFVLNRPFKVIEMNFLRELANDTLVTIYRFEESDRIHFKIADESTTYFVARVEY